MSITDSADLKGANPEGTGPANSPDNSQSEVISALEQRLKDAEGQLKSLRSDKDKGITNTNKRLSDFEKKQEELLTMQSYLKEYGTPERAAREMAVDAMLQMPTEQDQPQSNPQQTAPAGQEAKQTGEDNLVPLLGVDAKDPEFVTLLGAGMTPNDAAIAIATKRNQKNQVQVSDQQLASGASGATGGGASPEGSQQSVLEQQYREQLSKIKQGDFRAIGRLKDEFRGKGYEVY